MINRSVSVACVVMLAAAVVIARPAAQQPDASPQQPTFRGGVDSVNVDALVTDKQGKPVTDLTADDFEIREGGKLQTIQAFKLVQIDDGRDDPQAQTDMLSFDDEKRETAREDNRLFVIFLDDYHVQVSGSLNVRERLAAFVNGLTPHDLVAIATPWGTVTGLTFSRDHDATAAEIMKFIGRKYDYTPRNPIEEQVAGQPPEAQEQFRNGTTIAALSRLCSYLGSLRDGRKSILYVSEGMTGTLPAGVRTRGYNGPSVTRGNPLPTADASRLFENSSIDADLKDVFIEATRANASIYTIDPRGLVGLGFNVDQNVSINDAVTTVNDENDSLKIIADGTDGRAIVGRNDPLPQLRQMVQDSSTYYLLGYTSSLAPRDGKFHEIQVRVKRKDVEVRARKGYWAYSSEDIEKSRAVAKPGPSSDVVDALESLATVADPGRRRPVMVWMGALRGSTQKAHVTFAWEASPPTSNDPADAVDHVTITATSIYGDELFRGAVPRMDDATRMAGEVAFDAPAGTVHVHLVAENAKNVRVDTDDSDIEVPDFTATGPTITAPFVYRGRTARDLQLVRAATAPVPTPVRSFSRTERILLRFGVYGPAGTAPAVTMRLLNQFGASIAALPNPTALDGNLVESEIGLVGFPPGDYVIEITATATSGDVTKKLVAIHVTG